MKNSFEDQCYADRRGGYSTTVPGAVPPRSGPPCPAVSPPVQRVLMIPLANRTNTDGNGIKARGNTPLAGPSHPGQPGSRRAARAGSVVLGNQAVRTRVRAVRLSARRSSSLKPPQTPESCPVSSAQLKQSLVTAHRLQTAFASSTWRSAGPVVPIGKKSSGSSSRQSALWRQSMRTTPSLVSGHTARETLCEPLRLCRTSRQSFGCRIRAEHRSFDRLHPRA